MIFPGVCKISGDVSGHKILDEIKARGSVTFERYMDLALYHPEEGYYIRDREKIGAAGDFYTSPDVSPLFGKVLADQIEEMWRLSGCPDSWMLLEFGAGKGVLARDILNHMADKYMDLFQVLGYYIIEKSPSMILRQKKMLSEAPCPGRGIGWLAGVEELQQEGVKGCFFSNELLDAFPVHRVVMDEGRVREIYVAWDEGRLVEVADSLSRRELSEYIRDFGIELEEGQVIEINLAMRDWLHQVARVINRGFLLTIDYGDISGRLYSPSRPRGTIRSYRKHRLVDDLYESPGEQDITAHVNFSALARWGEESGLNAAGYTAQTYFLMNLGILDYLNSGAKGTEFDPLIMKETMAVKKLIMPEGMGSVFKVAAQCKGFGGNPPVLTGFNGKYGSRG